MGMFDSFYIKTKCPHCGNEEKFEFQTKHFECIMNKWDVGDKLTNKGIIINDGIITNCLAGCNSKECREWAFKDIGYHSGFGRSFIGDIIIKDGKVNSVEVRKR